VLLLSAAALDRLWTAFRERVPGRIAGLAAAAVLALVGLAGVRALDGRIWGAFARQNDRNVAVMHHILDEAPGTRVYLAPAGDFFLNHQNAIQLDGNAVYLLRTTNPVNIEPEEPVPAIVVYASLNEEWANREERLGLLQKHYPDLPCHPVTLTAATRMCRMEIPPGRLTENTRDLFYIHRSVKPSWRRAFLACNYGLGRGGVISQEDLVSAPDAPLPAGLDSQSCRIAGRLAVPREGKVRFSVSTRDYILLEVAGKKVFDHRPPRTGSEASTGSSGVLRLKAGTYPVRMRVYLCSEPVPAVQVTYPGEEKHRLLGETR
jgi:hypothetical protein